MVPRVFSSSRAVFVGLIALVVALMLLLAFPSAGSAEVLHAGVGAAEIKPPADARINGFPVKTVDPATPRVAEGVRDPLRVRCVVLEEGETCLALTSCDMGSVPATMADRVRELVTAKVPIPAENILLGATHTHQGVFLGGTFSIPPLTEVRESLAQTIAEAIVKAYADRKPARMGTGRGFIELSHNRRFIRREGTITSVPRDLPKRRYYGPVDHEVGVIRIDDTNGAPIAVLVNYTAHPTIMRGSYRLLSAEYPGVTARHVSAKIGGDVEVLFFSGALGNIAAYQDRADDWERMEEVGKALGDEVLGVYPAIETVSRPGITVKHRQIPFEGRAPGVNEMSRLHMIAFGDMVIMTVDGELFVQIGLEFKRRCPLAHPMVFGLVDGCVGYIPHRDAYQYGGYGVEMFTKEENSRRTLVPVGFAERILDAWLEMMYEQADAVRR